MYSMNVLPRWVISKFTCSWTGRTLPKVRFVNGREEIVGPEKFTADFPGLGSCERVQVGPNLRSIETRNRVSVTWVVDCFQAGSSKGCYLVLVSQKGEYVITG